MAGELGDPVGVEYFTGFDDSNWQGFLSAIPWINPNQTPLTNVDQSSDHALSGSYSCLFTEGTVGTSELETKNLSIPTGTVSATLGGWIYVGASAVTIDVHLVIDGTDHASSWVFAADDVGQWVERYAVVEVPAGSQTFYGWIKLHANGDTTNNRFWLDNYGVDFAPLVEIPPALCLVGDTGGGLTAIPAAATGSPAAAWTTQVTGGQILAPIATANGIAYVVATGASGTLHAVRLRDGALMWPAGVPLSERSDAAPVIHGGEVVVATDDGWVHAYAVGDGSIAWMLDVWQLGTGRIGVVGAVVDRGRLYITSDSGAAAVDLAARQRLWITAPHGFTYPAAVGIQGVYAGCADGTLLALDPSSGAIRWQYACPAAVNSEPQVLRGAVVFGADDGTVRALAEADGAVLATQTFAGSRVSCFLVYGSVLYTVANAAVGAVYAHQLMIDQGSGAWSLTALWTSAALNDGAAADPAVSGNRVFVTAADGTLRAYDATDGTNLWSYQPPEVAFAPPLVAAPPPAAGAATLKYSDVCWLCAHNAFANAADGWFYAQQGPSIPDQLDAGVRALMIDLWMCGSDVVYAHDGLISSVLIMHEDAAFKRFADSLVDIKAWLDANPSEIVTLFLEQRTFNKAATQAAVDAAGIRSYLYDPVAGGVLQNGWPTIASMIANGQRLVVFSDWGYKETRLPNGDGFPNTYAYCVENQWGSASLSGNCEKRGESQPIATQSIALFVQNYAVTFSANWVSPSLGTTLWRRFDRINDSQRIMQFVYGCNARHGRWPNFLAVDWFHNGDNGGPRQAVALINKLRGV